jgi:hypothetical protein
MNVLGLSNYHEANLRKLATEGLRIPDDYEHFNMSDFRYEGGDFTTCTATSQPMPDGCGTSACMVGHAPFLGLPQPLEKEGWMAYTERLFGVDCDESSTPFDFMFGCVWANEVKEHRTARACASRILWALEHDVPNDDDWTNYVILPPAVDMYEEFETLTMEQAHEVVD